MENAQVFDKSKTLLLASRIVIWTWFWLALLVLGLLSVFIFKKVFLFLVPLVIFLPSALIYAVLAFRMRCQGCNRFVTVQPIKTPPFADENNVKGFNGWAGIILNVFFNRKFTCMHCGKKYEIKK